MSITPKTNWIKIECALQFAVNLHVFCLILRFSRDSLHTTTCARPHQHTQTEQQQQRDRAVMLQSSFNICMPHTHIKCSLPLSISLFLAQIRHYMRGLILLLAYSNSSGPSLCRRHTNRTDSSVSKIVQCTYNNRTLR